MLQCEVPNCPPESLSGLRSQLRGTQISDKGAGIGVVVFGQDRGTGFLRGHHWRTWVEAFQISSGSEKFPSSWEDGAVSSWATGQKCGGGARCG